MLNLVSGSIIRWAGLHIRHCSFCHLYLDKNFLQVFLFVFKAYRFAVSSCFGHSDAKLISCRTFYFEISVHKLITAARKSIYLASAGFLFKWDLSAQL